MNRKEVIEKTKLFVKRFVKSNEFTDDDDLFATGFINSLFAMQLVLFLEKEFNIIIDNNDLDPNNFRSINSIASLITSKSNNELCNVLDQSTRNSNENRIE